jgi:hypothetical protein
MRKAQAAMEFMMTYGWAILVVLIAITALAYFGVLSPDKFLPEKCTISTGSGLFCSNFNADTTTNIITLRIKNSLTDSIQITANANIGGAADCAITNAPLNIAADTESDATFLCAGGISSGDTIRKDISIEFSVSGFVKQTSGSIILKIP